jgi:hypothetical protein
MFFSVGSDFVEAASWAGYGAYQVIGVFCVQSEMAGFEMMVG